MSRDLLTFLHNHYLNTDTGKALIKAALGDDPTIHDAIMNQLDIHNQIMQKLALGNEMPMEGQSAPIPQPMPAPQPQAVQPPQPNMIPYGPVRKS